MLYLRNRIPASLFYNNLAKVSPHPRLGSFDVSLRSHGSAKTQLVYSKMSKSKFPLLDDVVAQINSIVTPEVLVFCDKCPLEIQVSSILHSTVPFLLNQANPNQTKSNHFRYNLILIYAHLLFHSSSPIDFFISFFLTFFLAFSLFCFLLCTGV